MIYSVMYAHLEKPLCKIGDLMTYGDKVGVEGSTGISTGIHGHISVVEGIMTSSWTLASMVKTYKPAQQECKYFIENDIWVNGETEITTDWLGYKYHYAYDIVNKIKNSRTFQWNRSFVGIVTQVGYNSGYGNYVIIMYTTSERLAKTDNTELTNKIIELNKQISALSEKNTKYKSILDYVKESMKNE